MREREREETLNKEKMMQTGERLYAAMVTRWLPMEHLFSFSELLAPLCLL